MFTIRLKHTNGDETVVTSPVYNIRRTYASNDHSANPMVTHAVVSIPNPYDKNAPPTEYMVGDPPNSPGKGFNICYVENSAGKTCARIGPYPSREK